MKKSQKSSEKSLKKLQKVRKISPTISIEFSKHPVQFKYKNRYRNFKFPWQQKFTNLIIQINQFDRVDKLVSNSASNIANSVNTNP